MGPRRLCRRLLHTQARRAARGAWPAGQRDRPLRARPRAHRPLAVAVARAGAVRGRARCHRSGWRADAVSRTGPRSDRRGEPDRRGVRRRRRRARGRRPQRAAVVRSGARHRRDVRRHRPHRDGRAEHRQRAPTAVTGRVVRPRGNGLAGRLGRGHGLCHADAGRTRARAPAADRRRRHRARDPRHPAGRRGRDGSADLVTGGGDRRARRAGERPVRARRAKRVGVHRCDRQRRVPDRHRAARDRAPTRATRAESVRRDRGAVRRARRAGVRRPASCGRRS